MSQQHQRFSLPDQGPIRVNIPATTFYVPREHLTEEGIAAVPIIVTARGDGAYFGHIYDGAIITEDVKMANISDVSPTQSRAPAPQGSVSTAAPTSAFRQPTPESKGTSPHVGSPDNILTAQRQSFPPRDRPSTITIDHLAFPHIIDLILAKLPYDALSRCGAVCREWRGTIDKKLVKYVEVEFSARNAPSGQIEEGHISMRSVCPLTKSKSVMWEGPSSAWTFEGEEGKLAEASRRAKLENVEIVDYVNFIPVNSAFDLHKHSGDCSGCPLDHATPTCLTAFRKVKNLIDHASIVRWRGDSSLDTSDLGPDESHINQVPRMLGFGSRGRVFFCTISSFQYSDFFDNAQTLMFSPMFVNLDIDDSPRYSDHEEYGERYSFTWRMPMFSQLLGDGDAPPMRGGVQPHLTIFIDGSVLSPGRERTAIYLHHFIGAVTDYQGWTIWVVGLEAFLGRKRARTREGLEAWEELKSDVWREWEGRLATAANLRFLTRGEYRQIIKDEFLYKLRTSHLSASASA